MPLFTLAAFHPVVPLWDQCAVGQLQKPVDSLCFDVSMFIGSGFHGSKQQSPHVGGLQHVADGVGEMLFEGVKDLVCVGDNDIDGVAVGDAPTDGDDVGLLLGVGVGE